MNELTDEQIQMLADIVHEQFGSCLNEDELTDHILLLLEDVAGFETAPDRLVRQILNDVRRYYDGKSSESTDK
jgi:hypothetical protein